ncbi:MAG: hypothetical protein CMK64_04965 [Pseudoalteromonas sp.]|nr:hypothetical protein [Pseudoalteromonas sp.]|tara:strand:+ start:5250 stop:5867 length:618 start_codon:yes stop_codon:yes gene_type:complete
MDTIQSIYQTLLVITPGSDVFSLQILLLSLYVIALVFSMARAHKDQERITDFLSTITATIKYALTAILVEIFLEYARHPDNISNNFASIQNIYLYLFFINIAFVFIHYQIHLRFSFVYGRLYQVVKRVFLWHGFLHLMIWFKFVVFNIQEDLLFIEHFYSFFVVYLNITLFIAMIKPSLLKRFYLELILAPMYAKTYHSVGHVQR